MTRPRSEYRDHMQAVACRRLWSAVVLSVLQDAWTELERGKVTPEIIRANALRYFRSRDGRTVMALAGIDVDPERLANIAADPAMRERTKHREAE